MTVCSVLLVKTDRVTGKLRRSLPVPLPEIPLPGSGAKGRPREVHVDTFEVIVSIGVTVIAICNLVTTLRR